MNTGAKERLVKASEAIGTVVRGHPNSIDIIIAALLARGHVLIEDVPGVGKTTLARAVAAAFGCKFSRIQFTSDMLPSDVIGVQVLDPKSGALTFQKGPIFANIVLADEINRASPRTQSALLEAMSDSQVTVDDTTYELTPPFCVLATQNPIEQHGAYPLPESQLDRFMVRVTLGYPSRQHERDLLMQQTGPGRMAMPAAHMTPVDLAALQRAVDDVRLADDVAEYILDIVERTRAETEVLIGVSPRGALSLAQLCRAHAFLLDRDFVTPDDVKWAAVSVLSHRLQLSSTDNSGAQRIIHSILERVHVPR